jgi:hypothetical protein
MPDHHVVLAAVDDCNLVRVRVDEAAVGAYVHVGVGAEVVILPREGKRAWGEPVCNRRLPERGCRLLVAPNPTKHRRFLAVADGRDLDRDPSRSMPVIVVPCHEYIPASELYERFTLPPEDLPFVLANQLNARVIGDSYRRFSVVENDQFTLGVVLL